MINIKIMTETPIRLDSNDLGCPRCKTKLELGNSPFTINDEYVGHFESLFCSICHYHLLTAEGYDKAIKQASKFGLVGSEEEYEIDDTVEEHFTVYAPLSIGCYGIEKISLGVDEDESLVGHNEDSILLVPTPSNCLKSKTRLTNF